MTTPTPVIFDMDGVLVDSHAAHFASWQRTCAEHGLILDAARFAATFGMTSGAIIRELFGDRFPDPAAQRALDDRKEALYRELVADDFPAVDGARELVQALAAAGHPLALGSSGPPENVALVLDQLGVRDLFAAVVTGRDVSRGKPDPQVFLLAAERLGLPPEGCVVIEDAPVGVAAAKAAGMCCIGFCGTGRPAAELAGADRVVASLREVTPANLCGTMRRRP